MNTNNDYKIFLSNMETRYKLQTVVKLNHILFESIFHAS